LPTRSERLFLSIDFQDSSKDSSKARMKILLIDPPFYRILGFYNRYFPLGLATIGTCLKNAGYNVSIYDADCNFNPQYMDYSLLTQHYPRYLDSFKEQSNPVWNEVKSKIAEIQPDIVGISIWTTYAASAFYVARLCKEINPACAVVMGGPHATAKAEEILNISPDVDYVVRGDGETAMLELARQLSSGSNSVSSIPGLSFRNKNAVEHNPSFPDTNNLKQFPSPDRTLLMNEDKYTSEDMGLIMSSRGCPFACTYCATHTRRVSYMPIGQVMAEINFVKNKYGTTVFSFKDDSFTVNKRNAEEFCERLIASSANINWECNTRVDLINGNLLSKMKKAGCNSIKVGIESGSERILKKMNKGITRDQVRKAANLLKESGIFWTGYFMMGVPGESAEEMSQTLDFMYEIKPDFASISVYEPFPGTPMFNEGVEKGLVKPDMTLSDFYTIPPNHYYKIDPRRQLDTLDEKTFNVLAQELKTKFHTYNKNYKRLWHRAKSRAVIYVNQPRVLWSDFNKYLSWR
jgi:anaerobic magnesium-protoporphyrin IX monomethyl ester cyclase